MRSLKIKHEKGFTLIEVIITITIVALVGAMLYQYLGTSMTGSSLPIKPLQQSFALHQVMENIVTAYWKYYAGDLPGLKISIGAEGSSSTPDNKYGQYTVVENHYIKFVSNQEETAGDTDMHNLLKVTIKNSNNETLTYVFAG